MREVIAKRYKKTYLYMLIFSAVMLVPTIASIWYSGIGFVNGIMLVAFAAAVGICVIVLADKGGVIEREGDTFIIKRGIARSVVNISDVTNAYRTPSQKVRGELQEFSITVIVREGGEQKEIILYDVLDEDDAVNNILRCLR